MEPRRAMAASAIAALVASLSMSCSKSAPPPAAPIAPPMTPTPTSAPIATTPPAPATPPGPAPGSPDAMLLAVDHALDVAMLALADREAPGMKPEGQPLRVTLRENELSAFVVTLHPGRCYTFIAMSGPLQVTQLDMKLMLLPFNIESLHTGPKDTNPVFLGRGSAPTCPVAPFDIQYRVDVTAKRGTGRIVAQMFSRPK
ncbi:MAG: hypothetical protein JST00_25630 [Deltaproteobacteria bacterium]|nr:hypothetical protein [Deltaproteobacteria bacterium]